MTAETADLKIGTLWAVPLLLIAFAPGTALAQEPARSFTGLESRIQTGDTIRVVDSGGKKTQGTFESLSDSVLRLRVHGATKEFREPAIREVQRELRDSIGNGTLKGTVIGAGAGVAAGVVATGEACESTKCSIGVVATTGAIGAGIGAAVGAISDSLRHSYATVFAGPDTTGRRLGISPFLSRDMKGVNIAVRF